MAKPTLLAIVQDLLSDMDGDEVNSLNDTIEAQQVATVVRNVYRGIVEEYDLQAIETVFQLEASGTVDRPTHMTIPSAVFNVTEVRYNTATSGASTPHFVEIPYVTPSEFLDMVSNNDASDAEYQSVTDPGTNFVFVIRNNRAPSLWTSLDGGNTVVFDSFDRAVDGTLQSSKTQCIGDKRNDLIIADTSLVMLPETMHQLLYNEAREVCFEIFKDGAPRKINETARISRMKAKERKNKVRTPARLTLPDYGRK
jgi:hypothetical protein